jgi:hypothetical protein
MGASDPFEVAPNASTPPGDSLHFTLQASKKNCPHRTHLPMQIYVGTNTHNAPYKFALHYQEKGHNED